MTLLSHRSYSLDVAGASDSIAGLGSKTDHIAPVPGLDAMQLGLNGDEATLLALIGRVSPISDVLQRAKWDEAQTIALLLSLRAKGAIRPARVSPPSAPKAVDAASLENVDLDPERKTEIIERERGIESQNHYEVLDIEPGASPERIKESYYELSRRFHPDRFYNKNLGSFRARIERIFRRIHEAYSVLSDPKKQSAYLVAHPRLKPKAPEPLAPREKTGVDHARDAERRSRLARHPYLAKAMKATNLAARGKAAMESGAYAEAYSNLQKASAIRSGTGELPELIEESRKKHEQARARDELQVGNQARVAGNLEQALKHFRMAHSLDPNLSSAAWRASEILLERGDGEEAHKLALHALTIEPRRADYHATLGRILLAQDSKDAKKAAKEHFEEALRLDPEQAEALKGLKKTRWPF